MRPIVLPVALALAGGLTLPAAADDWKQSYPITGKADVHLDTADGNVDVETWDQPMVRVEIEAPGWKIDSHHLRITDESQGDRIDVEVREPGFEFHFGVVFRSIRVKVHVPHECDLQLKTGDGNVSMRPISGNLDITTKDGDIHADGLSGVVSLHTNDGKIDVSGHQGRLQASSNDGHINVEGRFDELVLKTGDGSITVESENGSKIGDGWNIETRDGNVVTKIGTDLATELDARTNNGRVTVELPIKITRSVDRSSMTGDLNGGGPPLRIRTNDGSIRVEKL